MRVALLLILALVGVFTHKADAGPPLNRGQIVIEIGKAVDHQRLFVSQNLINHGPDWIGVPPKPFPKSLPAPFDRIASYAAIAFVWLGLIVSAGLPRVLAVLVWVAILAGLYEIGPRLAF